jgi:hypothetical protein
MNKPHKTFHVIGERRPDLDIERFAEALVAFAIHRLTTDTADSHTPNPDTESEREAS